MKEDNKIEKQIKERLGDYQEEVPSNLWKEIEQDLTPKAIPLWRRWPAVAAIALLCVASSVTVYFISHSSNDYINNVCEQNNKLQAEQKAPHQFKPLDSIIDTICANKARMLAKLSLGDIDENSALDDEYDDGLESTQLVEGNGDVESNDESNILSTEKNNNVSRRKTDYFIPVNRNRRQRGWSLGFSGDPFSNSSSSMNDGYMHLKNVTYSSSLLSEPSFSSQVDYKASEYFASLSQQKAVSKLKHKQPVTFGLSLRFALDNEWMLDTGLDYTLLSSELTSGGDMSFYVEEQKLHYLGIPLKIGKNLWNTKLFSIYAMIGGEVEKCIKSKSETEYFEQNISAKKVDNNLDVDKLQLSTMATLGVQYKFNDKSSLFFEPGLRYYYKDGNDMQTIRKEHPLEFNIQLGYRFTFHK